MLRRGWTREAFNGPVKSLPVRQSQGYPVFEPGQHHIFHPLPAPALSRYTLAPAA